MFFGINSIFFVEVMPSGHANKNGKIRKKEDGEKEETGDSSGEQTRYVPRLSVFYQQVLPD